MRVLSVDEMVRRAMQFAIAAHGSQVRKYTGEPYWKHAAEVAGILSSAAGVTPEMLAAAWLHDVIEDTETTIEEIACEFGDEVARLVLGVSDISRPEDGSRAHRKQIDREHVAGGCWMIQSIKLADSISNAGSVIAHDLAFARVYVPEKRALLEVLTKGDRHLLSMAWTIVENAERHLELAQ